MEGALNPAACLVARRNTLCHGQCQAVLAHLKISGDISFKIIGPDSFRYIMRRTH